MGYNAAVQLYGIQAAALHIKFDGLWALTYIGVYCWGDRSAGIDGDRGCSAACAASVEHLLLRMVVLLLLQRGWVMLCCLLLLYNVVLLDRRHTNRHGCKDGLKYSSCARPVLSNKRYSLPSIRACPIATAIPAPFILSTMWQLRSFRESL